MYTATGKIDQQSLIHDHIHLVRTEAIKMIGRVPASVELDDLVQAGSVGLIQAAKQFCAEKGVEFGAYARMRIVGSIVDELRLADWAPRSVRRGEKAVVRKIQELNTALGRNPSEAEVAAAMEISIEEYRKLLSDVNSCSLMSVDEAGIDFIDRFMENNEQSPLDILMEEGFKDQVKSAIKKLPEREAMILALYYQEEMNLREIGEVLGYCESRVSQIHSQAVARLKAFIHTNVMPSNADLKKQKKKSKAEC